MVITCYVSVSGMHRREGLTVGNDTFPGEGKLQPITADLQCLVLIALTHSAPSVPAKLTQLHSSKLPQVF